MPVEAGYILIVSLRHALLRLAHSQIVAHTVSVPLLCFAERFVGQVHAGTRNLNQLLRRFNVKQRIANIRVYLRILVAQLVFVCVQRRLRHLGLAAQRELIEQRHGDGACCVSGSMRVQHVHADIPIISTERERRKPVCRGRLALLLGCFHRFHHRRQIFAIGVRLRIVASTSSASKAL